MLAAGGLLAGFLILDGLSRLVGFDFFGRERASGWFGPVAIVAGALVFGAICWLAIAGHLNRGDAQSARYCADQAQPHSPPRHGLASPMPPHDSALAGIGKAAGPRQGCWNVPAWREG